MSELLTVAMPKGRIFHEAVSLFQRAGFPLPSDLETSRKLIIPAKEAGFRVILAKPMDVATYVEHGVADFGVCGKDVMMEEERTVYEVLDLKISPCHLAVAGLPGYENDERGIARVASKYPNVADRYFRSRGEQAEIIKLNGSVELAPLIGLADRIVDIVSTGRTLKENGLIELERIANVTSRLIVNPASHRMKAGRIAEVIRRLSAVIEGQPIKK